MTALTDTELDALHAAVNHYAASVVAATRRLAIDSASVAEAWKHRPAFAAKLRDLAGLADGYAVAAELRYGAMRTALDALTARPQTADEYGEAVAP